MAEPANGGRVIRFGLFEVDLKEETLTRRGVLIRLQQKPFQLLRLLLENAGKVITREQLRTRLWPSDTFVEFDEGVNAAMGKLRHALGDSPENPVFVETVRGKGYRWIAPIEEVPAKNETKNELTEKRQDVELQRARISRSASRFWAIAFALVIFALVVRGLTFVEGRGADRQALIQSQRQLTTNSTENPILANAISADGKYLAYADRKGIHLKLLNSGETRDIAAPESLRGQHVDWGIAQNWFPDGAHFLVNTNAPFQKPSTWIASIAGEVPYKLVDELAPWAVSVKGSIAFTAKEGRTGDREIWVKTSEKESARKILEVDENSGLSMLVWSPDDQKLAFIRDRELSGSHNTSIEAIDLQTGTTKLLLSADPQNGLATLPAELRTLLWISNGRLIYSAGGPDLNGYSCNYWEIRVGRDGEIARAPSLLTHWSGFCILNAGATADGKKIVFQKITEQLHAMVADFDGQKRTISTPERLTDQAGLEYPTGWTADGQTVFYGANRNAHWEIFQHDFTKRSATLVATGLKGVATRTPAIADGMSILNVAPSSTASTMHEVWKLPITGGEPALLTAGNIGGLRCTNKSPQICIVAENHRDNKEVIFSRFDPKGGRGIAVARLGVDGPDAEYQWDLSPDASTIAISKNVGGEITLLSLVGKTTKKLAVPGWNFLRFVVWTADGQGFFASHPTQKGAALLHIDLRGNAKVLWELPGQNAYLLALPSPDGKRVAFTGGVTENNVWMMEDF